MKRIAGIIFLIFTLPVFSPAQVPYFQSYTILKRNEPVQVNVIYQDNAGFIWYGTNKGLFSFDGIDQVRFAVSDSLPDSPVTALAEDSLGRIWTGHKNGQIAILENGTVQSFDPPEGLSANEISDILFDRQGNLWFSTLNDGLYYFTQERLYRLDEEEGMPDIFVYDIVEDPAGNIWAGTDGGVAVCTLTDRKVAIRVLDYDHGLPDNIVKKIIIDQNNTVWLGTEDMGIISFDPITGITKPLLPVAWTYGATADFALNGSQVWIASPQAGLVVYDLANAEGKVYKTGDGFDFMSVNVLTPDREGNIWIGSRSGLSRTLGDHVEYINSFDPYTDSNVLSLTVDHQGSIWFSTIEGLFKRWVDDRGTVHLEKMLQDTPHQKYTIISMYCDFQGYLWTGFYGEGVLRIDPVTMKTIHLQRELANGNILGITGRDSTVWLATLGGATRIILTADGLDIRNYSRKDGLVSDYIYRIFVDSQGRVWFATDGKGVAMMDESGFHHYDKGLSSQVVYGFAEDGQHMLWVNVQGEGLFSFDGKSFLPLPANAALRDKNVHCFSSDAKGNLVAMHDVGIDLYNTYRKKMHYLGDEVGIQGRKPNLNALAKDQHGNIFLGTDQGIVKLSPRQDTTLVLPKPLITRVTAMDKNLDPLKKIQLAYDQNSVIIKYLGLWYQNPRNLNFQYKLENYDHDWIESVDRSATYSNLPPGAYTFLLRVSDSDVYSDATVTSFQFVIQPPFWRTTWFYLLSAMVFLYATYAFIKYSERKLVRDKKILEEKVMERTLEIQKQTEEIQAQNEEIQSQAEEIQGINDNLESLVRARTLELEKKNKASEESAFIIAHELRSPVASVLGLINLISKCEVDEETRVIIKHMEESAEKLNVVVRNITKAIERGDK